MDSLPNFLAHGASLRALRERENSANNIIDWVGNYKILGAVKNNELKSGITMWFIVKNASKTWSSPRILCRAGAAQDNIVKVYLSTVRFVLEYAVPVWQTIINSGLFIRCNRGSPIKGFEDNLSSKAESYTEALQFRANTPTIKKEEMTFVLSTCIREEF